MKRLKINHNSQFLQLLFIALALSLTLGSCKKDDPKVDCSTFHWGYGGDEGPNFWSECTPDCSGNIQSPINITGATADATLTDLETHYEAVPIEVINNGHTIEFEYEAGSKLTLFGADYELLQFHFHAGSEHTINGTQFPLEIHLVHKKSATELAVIGIMCEVGAENDFLKSFTDNLPAATNDHFSSATTVNLGDLLPNSTGYYTYGGSLTTPPCSEAVTWLVMSEPIQISADQLAKFTAILHDNFRPVQSLNGRTIKEHS